MDELFGKLQLIVADKLDVEASKVTPESSFRKDLDADSLDTFELVYAIEEELGITIPDEEASKFETVKDAFEFLQAQLNT